MMKLILMALLYYNMTCEIVVGQVKMQTVNSVSINQSIKLLSNTAEIALPRDYSNAIINGRIDSLERRNILDFIKVDDPVVIKLGYDEDLAVEFEGYVKNVGSDIPLIIECEDEMWKLRKTNFNKTFKKVSLSELLTYIAPDYEQKIIDDINLGKFIIQNASAYETLEALRKDYLMHSYFIGEVLHVGFPSDIIPKDAHQYNFNKNIRTAENLKYVRKNDVKLQIKAISNNSNGTKKVVTVGETGGAVRTLNFSNKTEAELKKLAESNLKTLSFDGYQGSFDAFGIPRVKAGEAAEIIDPNYPGSEREGTYLVEGVTKSFNESDGFKNEVKLSLKIS